MDEQAVEISADGIVWRSYNDPIEYTIPHTSPGGESFCFTQWVRNSASIPVDVTFERTDNSNDIDVYFTQNPVLTDIPFSGEKSESSSTHMIILIGKNTPSNSYRIDIHASCYDIWRLDGRKHSEAIEFTVGD